MVYTFAVYATLLVLQISHFRRFVVRPSLVTRFSCCRTSIPKGITAKSTWYLVPILALRHQDGGGTFNCERGHPAMPWPHSNSAVGGNMCRCLRPPFPPRPVLPRTQDHEDSDGSDGGGGRSRSALVQLQFHNAWGRVTPAKKPNK